MKTHRSNDHRRTWRRVRRAAAWTVVALVAVGWGCSYLREYGFSYIVRHEEGPTGITIWRATSGRGAWWLSHESFGVPGRFVSKSHRESPPQEQAAVEKPPPRRAWEWKWRPVPPEAASAPRFAPDWDVWSGPGFRLINTKAPPSGAAAGRYIAALTLRWWLLALVLLGPPLALRMNRMRRERRRRKHGQCVGCGYDLRGSPGVCPECGETSTATAGSPNAVSSSAASVRVAPEADKASAGDKKNRQK